MVRPNSPIHKQTFTALKALGTDYVRYVPWFPYPKMAVAELKPPTKDATFWDFTYLDSTMQALMDATSGHTVVINFSTTPVWMWQTDSAVRYPENPYQPYWDYNQGTRLRDTTVKELAAYYVRLFSWYTKGGFTDELGKFHKSGHYYKIPYWEVLNEPDLEHNMSPELYTRIYDEIVKELKKISPETKFIGLSFAYISTPVYFEYFLNPANHRYGIVPEGISYHHYSTPSYEGQDVENYQYTFFEKASAFLDKVRYIENIRKRLAPNTFTTINEIGTILRSPRVIKPIEKEYWNVSGAMYAYIFLELTKLGIDAAGESQLVGYPTQYPDVSMMNWETGNPNARYWVLKLLHDHFGPGDQLVATSFKGGYPDGVISQAFITKKGNKLLLINSRNKEVQFALPGNANGATLSVVDVSTMDNPPASSTLSDANITLKPFSVAVVQFK
ncbi:glycosyl hydrolase family 39 [Ilyomonas limi]|uniref:Glycosyl hydrolase family 39 n=2 Tax=Ilyomonas limi TaxID=2575867 RepID=A0A4U3L7L9_9BACT|nr:glycosyl hydrolase family 39 [Ilyomonas limi]